MSEKSNVTRNVGIVGLFTSLSRVLGLVREMLQSRLIGAGYEQSAFTLAFAIPNMARKLFGEGALTAAFVPIFKAEIEREAYESAKKLANAVITVVMMVLGSIVLLVTVGLSCYLGWAEALSARADLTIRLIRILFPYMLFICGAAFGMGVLNALGKFKAASFMPSLLNVVWIVALGMISFFPSTSLVMRVKLVSIAILFGGFLQMAFLFHCMKKRGFAPKMLFIGFSDPKVRLVWRGTFIAAVGAGAIQINYMLDQVLAQLAAPWAASVIGYAERLMDLPLGVLGVAFGTVLLPTFAGFFARGDLDGARRTLASSFVNLMFIMLPAAAGLAVLAPEITALIYEGGAFDSLSTVRVARALAIYALGLGFFGFQKTIVPWFQAQGDLKTPLRVSVIAVFVNATLNILAVALLPEEFRHVGLAASTVFCAAFSCMLLVLLARHKNGALNLKGATLKVAKILIASALMALSLYFLKPLFIGKSIILSLVVLIPAGMLAYAIFALIMLREEIRYFRLRKSR